MKRNVTLIARRGAQAALLSYFCNASRASLGIGLDFLNPSHNLPSRCRRFHSTIHTKHNGESVGSAILSFFDDTIYAVSTAPGRAGIAIIRVSGTGSLDVSEPMASSLCPSNWYRYIVHCAPRKSFLTHDTPLYGLCTTQTLPATTS